MNKSIIVINVLLFLIIVTIVLQFLGSMLAANLSNKHTTLSPQDNLDNSYPGSVLAEEGRNPFVILKIDNKSVVIPISVNEKNPSETIEVHSDDSIVRHKYVFTHGKIVHTIDTIANEKNSFNKFD